MSSDDNWIGTAAAAERLGVKPQTLYAYVSRGLLHRQRAPDGRGSVFNVAEIDRLARRSGQRRQGGPVGIVIESAITAIVDDRPYYRGRSVADLAVSCSFEEIASLLWTGELVDTAPWKPAGDGVAIARAALSTLAVATLPLERLQVAVAALAAADPLRLNLTTPAVVATAQRLIAGMVESLPDPGAAGRGGRPEPPEPAESRSAAEAEQHMAARLWRKLTPAPAEPGLLDALRSALVLLADHELAASTLAARIAASARADPYAVVATGLGAVGGALHGGAALGAETLLRDIVGGQDVARAVGDRLRRGERVPGFGHLVYRGGDPRTAVLLDKLRRAARGSSRLAAAEAVLAEAKQRRLPEPNIEFALGALATVAGMVPGAAEAIFAIARSVGWVAHAIEEYESGTPLRPRAVYTGPRPGDAGA